MAVFFKKPTTLNVKNIIDACNCYYRILESAFNISLKRISYSDNEQRIANINNDNFRLLEAFFLKAVILGNSVSSHETTVPAGYVGVYTAQDLYNVRNNLSGKYIQMADIDLSVYANFAKIGSTANRFVGVYNGNNFPISNLNMNDPTLYVGLFGYVGVGGVVKKVKLIDPSVYAGIGPTTTYEDQYKGIYTGPIAGYNAGTIEDCTVEGGAVEGSYYVGGIAGISSSSGKIVRCGSNITTIANSSAQVWVYYPTDYVYDPVLGVTIIPAHWEMTSRSYDYVGGIAGSCHSAENCYSLGPVRSTLTLGHGVRCGGAFGYVSSSATKCYSTGLVYVAYGGGKALAGSKATVATISDCYYDSQTAGVSDSYATAKTTAQMKTRSTFTDWDFNEVWGINSGEYPHLGVNTAVEPTPYGPISLKRCSPNMRSIINVCCENFRNLESYLNRKR